MRTLDREPRPKYGFTKQNKHSRILIRTDKLESSLGGSWPVGSIFASAAPLAFITLHKVLAYLQSYDGWSDDNLEKRTI